MESGLALCKESTLGGVLSIGLPELKCFNQDKNKFIEEINIDWNTLWLTQWSLWRKMSV